MPPKKAAGDTYSQAEVDALLAKQAAGSNETVEDISKREYGTIVDPDGNRVSSPPSEGGPLMIGGRHPDDFYGATKDKDGKRVATQNAGDLPTG